MDPCIPHPLRDAFLAPPTFGPQFPLQLHLAWISAAWAEVAQGPRGSSPVLGAKWLIPAGCLLQPIYQAEPSAVPLNFSLTPVA